MTDNQQQESVIPQYAPRLPITHYEANQFQQVSDALVEHRMAALDLYRPLPWAEPYHASRVQQKIIRGGNRAGKSLAAWVEDARCVLNRDPYKKYPEKDGKLIIIGQNWTHIGLNVYPGLFLAGQFKIIRDKVTGEFRSWNPLDPADLARAKETKPAPPLIPPRYIKSISYENKKERQCSFIELTTGWTINCFASTGDIPQGFSADRIHIDEDIEKEEWVGEMQARLSVSKGVLDWTAMPHAKNDALATLVDRALAQEEEKVDPPTVVQFQAHFLDNPYVDNEEKQNRIDDWRSQGDDVLNMRMSGEIGLSLLMYPTFQIGVHGLKYDELPRGQVPADWTRYMAVDPGYQVCGVLFGVVPPDERFVLIEGELYIRNCTSEMFGQKVQEYMNGRTQCHAFIIDAHGGALTDIVSGKNVKTEYSRALRSRGVESDVTGCDFIHGCDNLDVRANAVRLAMSIRPKDGTTRLRVLRGATDNLCRTLKRFKRSVQNGVILDKPNTRGDVHLAQVLEYLIAYDPKYHKPPAVKKTNVSPLRQYLRDKKLRNRDVEHSVFLGPQSAA